MESYSKIFFEWFGIAGSLASIVGLPIALITIWQARNAARKSAREAELSKDASILAKGLVEKSRQDIKLLGNVINFERALKLMDEVKSLIRNSTFGPVPEKISSLIVILNEVRAPSELVTELQSKLIQNAVVELREIENKVDGVNFKDSQLAQPTRVLKQISVQIDQLQPMLVQLRDKIGR